MSRDKNKDSAYFKSFVEDSAKRVLKFENWIATGKTPEARIPIVQRTLGAIKVRALVAKYSSGVPISEIERDYLELLRSFDSFWPAGQVLMDSDGDEPEVYVDYDDMLWMLSLGYLFKVPNQDFSLLPKLIDRDEVVDFLYEFIISAKMDREPKDFESYEFGWALYKSLREATGAGLTEADRISLLIRFLPKEWKRDHRKMLSALKSRHDIYYGAWSFESAAVVCILGLDDSRFSDSQFYPKDLVRFHRDLA